MAVDKLKKNYLNNIHDELVNTVDPNIYYCYQCGKCAAGCPLADVYEYQPNEVIRLIQLNKIDSILDANSVYLCLSCEICSSRCPQEVKIASIMNYLRIKSWQYKKFKLPLIRNFYRIFLKTVGVFGRSFEPLLILVLNIANRKFFNDFDIAFKILKKRKIKIIPEFVRSRKEVSEIIKQNL
ncbi:MAG: heterodisulfide reductase subunit C [Actinobacteria bacterium]|nr:heterodisulfide reductase subunit C [Actinomycetota bacterium]